MGYRIAGIDVHKRLLAVVVADVAAEGEFHFERRTIGTSPDQLRRLADWFVAQEVEEVVMESTAQYWRPVWETLERHWQPQRRTTATAGPLSGTLHLAQAQSNQGARGRKRDFADAERLVKRLVAQATALADGDAAEVPTDLRACGAAEPTRSAARRSAHQTFQPRRGSARVTCKAECP